VTIRKRGGWEPDWASPPGDTIRETLAELHLTQAEAAEQMGVSQPYLSGIITGRRAITPRVALRLEALTGVRGEFWARLWAQYAVAVERQEVERLSA
jgi:HTH-type transcriptional regulator/antitoxin HigA